MIIRQAQQEDIPAIVELLKLSLGESLMQKSSLFWKWKHLENPFGKSPVLVLEEEGNLIGVRAFLLWKYQLEGQQILAGRAVDTAIHPSFQGKGLFTKLTKKLLEQVQKENVQFIFNSPNKQSLPGYLKMAWETWGRLPLKVQLNLFAKKGQVPEKQDWRLLDSLIERLEQQNEAHSTINTHLVSGFIQWRYENCPVVDYHWISDQSTYLLIYRLKRGRFGIEFRIVDFFKTAVFSKMEKAQLNQRLKIKVKEVGAIFTSYSGLQANNSPLDLGGIPTLKQGPLVTLRNLNYKSSPLDLPWSWSLGDLELF